MAVIGLPVPPGLTISTTACEQYLRNEKEMPAGLWKEILEGLKSIEREDGSYFGDPSNPLLLSVRSGLAEKSGKRFAYDSYRRFLDMFGDVVMGISHSLFEEKLESLKCSKGVTLDTELTSNDLKHLVERYKDVYLEEKNIPFPSDPMEQLKLAVVAVFCSWNSPRAITYRRLNRISDLNGTAVNIQCMVFGNMGCTSGTGVLFTRNPNTGEKNLYGEFLFDAQGEDVVSGNRTPRDLEIMKNLIPGSHRELVKNCELLENHYGDMMDIEFTVQQKRLWILQCRSGKRTGRAALKIAVDMVRELLIGRAGAVTMVEPQHLEQLLYPQFESSDAYRDRVVATGLAASPGAAVGQVVFSAGDAEAWHAEGKSVILVRKETDPEDVAGMHAAAGILTARGGMTSHAAVIARGWGKCCVSGCSDIHINYRDKILRIGDVMIRMGDWLSLNGSTGEVILGRHVLSPPSFHGDDFGTIMSWADEIRCLKVMANADTPEDALVARNNGAQGIGLCRTEHMFFASQERVKTMRRMIMASTQEQRKLILDDLLIYQRSDFEGIFHVMDGLPVVVRLLDPPLHEFFPEGCFPDIIDQLAVDTGLSVEAVSSRISSLREVNPMLGFRGCRLGISHPELTKMQVRAVFEAAVSMSERGVHVRPKIMVPLVGTKQEMVDQATLIRRVAEDVLMAAPGVTVDYQVGTMIEIPRAALVADEIAEVAEFFSFGTNDLTQMTFGYSRDDASKFLPLYLSRAILHANPFEVLDKDGVGYLVKAAAQKGRSVRPTLEVGVCGEHGGDPSSIAFFNEIKLDYVSCSPYRIPIARLAAAHAVLGKC